MNTEAKITRIKQLLSSKDIESCRKVIENSSQHDLQNLRFIDLANDVCNARKKPKEALFYSKKIIKLNPKLAAGYVKHSTNLLALKRTKESLRIARIGLKLHPNHFNLLVILNNIQRELNNPRKALGYSKKLIDANPNNPISFIRCAQDLLKLNQHRKALRIASNGLRSHPANPVLIQLGITAAKAQGNTKQLISLSKAMIKNHPTYPLGYIRCTQALIERNRPAKAARMARKGLKIFPSDQILLQLGIDTARSTGRTNEALRHCKTLRKHHPQAPQGYFKEAQIHLQFGDLEKCSTQIKLLKEKTLSGSKGYSMLRTLYRAIGEREKCIQTYTQQEESDFQSTPSPGIELIADLIACNRLDEAEQRIQAEPNTHRVLTQKILPLLIDIEADPAEKKISPELRDQLKLCNIFPHFNNANFNPFPQHLSHESTKRRIFVIHIGKCAGESVIAALHRDLKILDFDIYEFHIFDSQDLIKTALNLFSRDPNTYWITCTRDPFERWISAYNWEKHTYILKNFYYTHPTIESFFETNPLCTILADKIISKEPEAIKFAQLTHLSYGHMAMGQNWYLPEPVIEQLPQDRTFTVRTENIHSDYNAALEVIYKIYDQQWLGSRPLPRTKNNIGSRYPSGSFCFKKDFSSAQSEGMKRFLEKDYICSSLLNQFLIRDRR